jgi:hypothetical protein
MINRSAEGFGDQKNAAIRKMKNRLKIDNRIHNRDGHEAEKSDIAWKDCQAR